VRTSAKYRPSRRYATDERRAARSLADVLTPRRPIEDPHDDSVRARSGARGSVMIRSSVGKRRQTSSAVSSAAADARCGPS